mgnify:CR=1 FL=1
MKRRNLLKTLGVAAGSALVGKELAAQEKPGQGPEADPWGILIDTTKCQGCGMCEWACARENGLPEPESDVDRAEARETTPTRVSVVNSYETEKGTVHVKRQCMHCLKPACASACLTRALEKEAEGPVTWDGDRCMGCRYCMVSCPFEMPKFEYDTPTPQLRKCQLCYERQARGELPACADTCPFGALQAGRRSELLAEARRRIVSSPDDYVHHIYGEHEAGGTNVLYLSSVPFHQIGFRTDLSEEGYPTFTREFLYAVPMVLALVPPFLLGLSRATRGGEGEE